MADGNNPTSGYATLKQCHSRAYEYLSKALQIDESGKGDVSEALDWYSKGVAELEKGVAVEAKGEEAAKIEKRRSQMMANLDMARGRVTDLLAGDKLKGAGGGVSSRPLLPTESLRFISRDSKVHPKVPPNKGYGGGPRPKGPLRNNPGPRPNMVRKHNDKEEEPDLPTPHSSGHSHIQGVDKQLAQKILDEVILKDTATTWDDVVGLELSKRTLQEIVILPALRPELFTGLRSPARGLLLFGPPGNGKTMLARAVAHESHSTFFNISASSLTSKWVGEGEKLVKALFAMARELQPSIIFMDEVDALLGRRSESDHDSIRRLKNEFLLSFDGMHTSEGEKVLVMAATNRPHELDDAALRRFVKRIYVPLPVFEARKTVIQKLLSKQNNTVTTAQLDELARLCDGYSASDLTALAKDSALGPIRDVDYDTLKSMPAYKVRAIRFDDFQQSMKYIRPSVSPELLRTLEEWNTQFGVSS